MVELILTTRSVVVKLNYAQAATIFNRDKAYIRLTTDIFLKNSFITYT